MRLQRLYDVRWHLVKQASFGYLNQLDNAQIRDPAQIITGVAVLLLLICERFKLEVRDVLDTAARVLRRAKEVEPQYPRGISSYLRTELPDDL